MESESIRNKFLKALENPNPYESLRTAAKEVLDKYGRDTAILHLQMLNQSLERDEEVTLNVLDCLTGWCGTQDRL